MSSLKTRIRTVAEAVSGPLGGLRRRGGDGQARHAAESQRNFVCHCRRVEYREVERAISRGASSVADLQRATTACTRCFGCRFELEHMLRDRLGDRYRAQTRITLPKEFAKTKLPRPMYMPVLAGFAGSPVDTRVVVFNWESEHDVDVRADLLGMDGRRVHVWNVNVGHGTSAVLDLSREALAELLPEGVGVVKLVLDTDEVGSLRPYFHFSTDTAVTSTHEKKGPADPQVRKDRSYHWIFPVGRDVRGEEAYLFLTNTQTEPMEGQRVVWQTDAGARATAPLPLLEFDQSTCFPLHEHFPDLHAGGVGGAVRLEPATHTVAGFMIRHDPDRRLWRVQHL